LGNYSLIKKDNFQFGIPTFEDNLTALNHVFDFDPRVKKLHIEKVRVRRKKMLEKSNTMLNVKNIGTDGVLKMLKATGYMLLYYMNKKQQENIDLNKI
jgi:hypothetical protein